MRFRVCLVICVCYFLGTAGTLLTSAMYFARGGSWAFAVLYDIGAAIIFAVAWEFHDAVRRLS